jgi:hypothetical protein
MVASNEGVKDEDQGREKRREQKDGPVLPPKERLGALLDRIRDLRR